MSILGFLLVSCSYNVTTQVTPQDTSTDSEVTVLDAMVKSDTENTNNDAMVQEENTVDANPDAMVKDTTYTTTDVSSHDNRADCWLILSGKVYNVTDFISKHPGGNEILKGCGKDATSMMQRHPAIPESLKESLYIGDLAQ